MMPPLTEPWKSRTDDELADNAQSGLQGQGAMVEAMRRLRESNEKLTRLLIGLTVVLAVAAIIATVEGATSAGGVQSPSGGSMVPVLALVVAALAVFFGPLVARANTQRQIRAAAREAWMREFREKVAALLTNYGAFVRHLESHTTGDPEKEKRLTAINDAMAPAYHTLRLLVAEKAPQHGAFSQFMDGLFAGANTEHGASPRIDQLSDAAIEVLRCERAAEEDDPGVWREVWTSLGLDAVAWPAWLRGP